MVLQETWLKSCSIAENIAYGKPDATMDEIIEAARKSHAHGFISRLENGYDTVISPDGGNLSAGQKQLLCIARVMLAIPPILILDEATASVDTKTEKAIQAALNILIQGRTTLSIAHRLSTLRDANHLIVIEKGRIEEEGSRQELDELGGIYHMLAELQTKSLALKGIEED